MRSPQFAGAEPLYSTRLTAQPATASEVVLLAGWSMDQRVWRQLLPALRTLANVTLIDLPGTGHSPMQRLDERQYLHAILACAPPRAHYIGWSLGGMLALKVAALAPQRVQGVVSLAANLRFVANADWPHAMALPAFTRFRQLLRQDRQRALARFDVLQTRGGGATAGALRACRELRRAGPAAGLSESLGLLARLDLRADIAALTVPVSHVLGREDALVPAAAGAAIRQRAPSHRLALVADCNHLLPWYARDQVLAELRGMLSRNTAAVACPPPKPPRNRQAPPREPPSRPDPQALQRSKRAVARSFSRAAAGYDAVAQLQHRVGAQLLQQLPGAMGPLTVLDLGSGTGRQRLPLLRKFPQADYVGLDLAEGMVRFAARSTAERTHWLVADAESLPLPAASVDIVFSNLTLQWSERLGQLFAELRRVLRPAARVHFSSLGPATLWQLRQAWQAVDNAVHVNRFVPPAALAAAARAAGFTALSLQTRTIALEYGQLLDLLRELRAIGAHNVNAGRRPGLCGRQALRELTAAYEVHRRDGRLPASYEIILGAASNAA